jgi:glutamate-ammonia-ligase adenylyltransferase
VSLLADEKELQPRSAWQVRTECEAAAGRAENLRGAAAAVRGVRRREMFRIAAGSVLELTHVDAIGHGLSDIADASIAATLDAAIRAAEEELGRALPTRIAIIGMGRLGGAELSFGSDADVMFVHDPLPGIGDKEATDIAMQVVGELRRVLTEPSTEPALEFDADLRPEGKSGPLVRTLASYAAYYERWSAPWESQALVRARVVGGDLDLGANFIAMVDTLRWPADGLTDEAIREIRRLKARMEAERLPRGADPTLHTKLGRGGLSDVEWTAQLLQMQHAHKIAELRTTNTLEALRACVSGGVLGETDAVALSSAWVLATRVRDAVTLARGISNDVVPTAGRDLGGVAHLLGYLPSERGALVEDYRRVTRRARVVMDRVFYGV